MNNFNPIYDKIGSAYRKMYESEGAADNVSQEGLSYENRFIPSSTMKVGSVEWQVFNMLKYNNNNRSMAIRRLKEHIEFMEDASTPEDLKQYDEEMKMLRGGAVAVVMDQVKKEPRNPIGSAVTTKEWNAAKRKFGITTNPKTMGYILPDGNCLDFSGRVGAYTRGLDHRDIGSVIQREQRKNTSYGSLVDVVLSGAIRYIYPRKFMIGKLPTQRQWSSIWDIFDATDDYDDEPTTIELCANGDFDDTVSVEYTPKTSVSRIKSDVTDFFNKGEVPEGNYTYNGIVEANTHLPNKGLSKHIEESVYDDYNVDTLNIIEEFKDDKERGIKTKQWNLIDPDQYAYALKKFVDEGPELFRFSERVIDDWIELIVTNTKEIESIGVLDGREELGGGTCIDHYQIEEEFPDEFHREYDKIKNSRSINGIDNAYVRMIAAKNVLDIVGFYDWAVMPDGNPADSDNGIAEVRDLLENIDEDSSISDKLIAINRCLDVFHKRSDWSSAFIKGGRKSLDIISDEKRYMAINHPLKESFVGENPVKVKNIIASQQFKHFVGGLKRDGDNRLEMSDKLIKDILTTVASGLFSERQCFSIEYSPSATNIKFEMRLLTKDEKSLDKRTLAFLKTSIEHSLKESFPNIFTYFTILDVGNGEYICSFFINDYNIVKKINMAMANKKFTQEEFKFD